MAASSHTRTGASAEEAASPCPSTQVLLVYNSGSPCLTQEQQQPNERLHGVVMVGMVSSRMSVNKHIEKQPLLNEKLCLLTCQTATLSIARHNAWTNSTSHHAPCPSYHLAMLRFGGRSSAARNVFEEGTMGTQQKFNWLDNNNGHQTISELFPRDTFVSDIHPPTT